MPGQTLPIEGAEKRKAVSTMTILEKIFYSLDGVDAIKRIDSFDNMPLTVVPAACGRWQLYDYYCNLRPYHVHYLLLKLDGKEK